MCDFWWYLRCILRGLGLLLVGTKGQGFDFISPFVDDGLVLSVDCRIWLCPSLVDRLVKRAAECFAGALVMCKLRVMHDGSGFT